MPFVPLSLIQSPYPQLEAWIKEQPGVKLDAETISALNDSITGYIHDDATRQAILSANGLADGDPKDAINLNNLDDWLSFTPPELLKLKLLVFS